MSLIDQRSWKLRLEIAVASGVLSAKCHWYPSRELQRWSECGGQSCRRYAQPPEQGEGEEQGQQGQKHAVDDRPPANVNPSISAGAACYLVVFFGRPGLFVLGLVFAWALARLLPK